MSRRRGRQGRRVRVCRFCDAPAVASVAAEDVCETHLARLEAIAADAGVPFTAVRVGERKKAPHPKVAARDAAEARAAAAGTRPKEARTYKPKACRGCTRTFTPTGPRGLDCDTCKAAPATTPRRTRAA